VRWRLRNARPEAPSPTQPPASPNPDPAARGARSARVESSPSSLSPFERAATRFNASEAGRTVTGLVRTLGTPWVSVGASAGSPTEVRVTVAWELCWYQWGVELGEGSEAVSPRGKGSHIEQLDGAARQWNAALVDGGRVVLAAPGKAPAPPAL
jgi:hypothetical protein